MKSLFEAPDFVCINLEFDSRLLFIYVLEFTLVFI